MAKSNSIFMPLSFLRPNLNRFKSLFRPQLAKEKAHIYKMRFYFILRYTVLLIMKGRIKLFNRNRKLVAISLIEHLGDIVACEPVSRHVRQKYPEAYIVWCVRRPYRELIDNNPYIDKAFTVCCLTEWIYLAKSGLFEDIIDLHLEGRLCPICKVSLKKTTGDASISFNNYLNLGNILSVFSRCAGLPELNNQPQVYSRPHDLKKAQKYKPAGTFMVVHCLANEHCRNWQDDKWKELVLGVIEELKVPVVEIGLAPVIRGMGSSLYIDLCGKLSILETAELIRAAKIFIGVESGFAHIANAVNTYGVILMGEYNNFKHYIPYSGPYAAGQNASLIYQDGPAAGISVERVREALRSRFK